MTSHQSCLLEPYQVEQLHRIADLIRGDWSGSSFDGRDVKKWIMRTLSGEDIRKELSEYEDNY